MKKKLSFSFLLLFLFIWILVSVDQIAKLIIANFFMDSQVVLIDGVLSIHPQFNTGLSYLMRGINLSPIAATMIGGVQLGIYGFFGRYFIYLLKKRKALILYYVFASFGIAMFICRAIDVVCWGGSLDFIKFYNIIYDVKDLYTVGIISFYILLIMFIIQQIKCRTSLSKEEHTEKGFGKWIKEGCPLFERPL